MASLKKAPPGFLACILAAGLIPLHKFFDYAYNNRINRQVTTGRPFLDKPIDLYMLLAVNSHLAHSLNKAPCVSLYVTASANADHKWLLIPYNGPC